MIIDLSSAKKSVAELEKINISEIQNSLDRSKVLFTKVDDCRKLYSKIRRKCGALDRKPKNKINFREVGSMLNLATTKVSSILEIKAMAKSIGISISKLENKKEELLKSDSVYMSVKEEYELFLESIGNICPLCNQEMSDKCREAIIEGV